MLKEEILKYLQALQDKLKSKDVKGEICLYGGAVMCLVFDARPATKDVDAVFQPSGMIREFSKEIAEKYDLPDGWLNDGVKGFLVEHSPKVFINWSHLTVYSAEPEYLLAMKAFSARLDSMDRKDIEFLIQQLNIYSAGQVFEILAHYYPNNQIKPATQFFIEEIFNEV
jgi:hypothetical protein